MNYSTRTRGNADARGSYFFLSYAHSPPLAQILAGDPPEPPDEWVRRFFRDLKEAVRNRVSATSSLAPGFFDRDIPLDSDWKATLSRALGTAQVFVPLYSPGYLARSWSGREWACFEQRLKSAKVANPMGRFMPVLWIPLPADYRPRGLAEALSLAPEPAVGPYLENGLRALLRLTPYRSSYEMIVARLAERIVQLAETAPIEPSEVPDIDQMTSPFGAEVDATVFAVVVAAPALPEVPQGSNSEAYRNSGSEWRPFGHNQELSLAEYAQLVAEQLDFAVLVTEIEKAGDLLNNAPGVVLIDPWYLARQDQLEAFRDFTLQLPPWVLPVLVFDPNADPNVGQHVEQARTFLEKSRMSKSDPARRGLHGVASLPDFVGLMPFLVAQAEREYLRRGPIQRPTARPGSRPRLSGGGWHAGQPVKENPHV